MKRGHESGRRSSPSPLRGGGRPSRQRAGTASATDALPSRQESSALSPDLVLMGEFGRAHGLRGEVRLKSFTADPKAIAAYGPLVTASGASVTLVKLRSAGAAPDLFIAEVRDVTTREGAEALNRVRLYLHRSKLPPPDDEDEFLLADLIGSVAQDASGKVLGTVVDLPNYGGGDLIEIAPLHGGDHVLLPFTKAFVPVVDPVGRRVVIAPPDDAFEAGDARSPDDPSQDA